MDKSLLKAPKPELETIRDLYNYRYRYVDITRTHTHTGTRMHIPNEKGKSVEDSDNKYLVLSKDMFKDTCKERFL